jgi:hypothetical protein
MNQARLRSHCPLHHREGLAGAPSCSRLSWPSPYGTLLPVLLSVAGSSCSLGDRTEPS